MLEINSTKFKDIPDSFAKKEVFMLFPVDSLIYYSTVFSEITMLFSMYLTGCSAFASDFSWFK